MKCSQPIAPWASIAVRSIDVSGIFFGLESASLVMTMECGMLVGWVVVVSWWVSLFRSVSFLFLWLIRRLMRLSLHFSGIVAPLSSSLECWFIIVMVGMDVVAPSLLSWSNGDWYLMLFCRLLFKSWWNGSISRDVELSFYPLLANSKQTSSDSIEFASIRDIICRRGFMSIEPSDRFEKESSSSDFLIIFRFDDHSLSPSWFYTCLWSTPRIIAVALIECNSASVA